MGPRAVGGVPGIRVEELARRADVSVDTIRFYQKRHLLPAPRREGRVAWYDAEHEHRLARIKELQRRGFSLAIIRRLLDGELDTTDAPLAAAVVGAQHGDAELLDRDQLAARVGIPTPLVDAVVREGLLVPQQRDGRAGYTVDDVDVLRSGLRLLEAGFPLNELLALARRHHDATRAIAADAVEMFDTYVRQPLRSSDASDDEKAEQLVAAFGTLLPTVTSLVAHHFRSVLLEVAQEHLEAFGSDTELAAARDEPGWERERASRAGYPGEQGAWPERPGDAVAESGKMGPSTPAVRP
jgi:DNA-binding transcriptional MerR regulator